MNLFILVFYFFITVNLHVHRNDLQNKDAKHYFQYGMYVGIISSISKQCSLFLIHILTQSLVMVLKFGAFIRVMMLKKFIYNFVNDYWV